MIRKGRASKLDYLIKNNTSSTGTMSLEIQEALQQKHYQLPKILCGNLFAENFREIINKREEAVWFFLLCPLSQKAHCFNKLISNTCRMYVHTTQGASQCVMNSVDMYMYVYMYLPGMQVAIFRVI